MHYDHDPEDYLWETPPALHPRREAFTKMLTAIIVITLIIKGVQWLWN